MSATRRRSSSLLVSIALAMPLALGGVAHAEMSYRLIDLGPGIALGVNDSGQVLAASAAGTGFQYVFTPSNGRAFLPSGFVGGAMNDLGVVAGEYDRRAATFSFATGLTFLGSLDGESSSAGYAINNAGQVAGWAQIENTVLRPFRWSASTGMVPLGPATIEGQGLGINDAGQVAGARSDLCCRFRAFVDTPGSGLINIDVDDAALAPSTVGFAINNAGQVTGMFGSLPFLYTPGAGIVRLTPPPQFPFSFGRAINNNGAIVGIMDADGFNGGERAFIHTGQSGVVDLNSLLEPGSGKGWQLAAAIDINDHGQIVGRGLFNGDNHAFLLTPVNGMCKATRGLLAALVGK